MGCSLGWQRCDELLGSRIRQNSGALKGRLKSSTSSYRPSISSAQRGSLQPRNTRTTRKLPGPDFRVFRVFRGLITYCKIELSISYLCGCSVGLKGLLKSGDSSYNSGGSLQPRNTRTTRKLPGPDFRVFRVFRGSITYCKIELSMSYLCGCSVGLKGLLKSGDSSYNSDESRSFSGPYFLAWTQVFDTCSDLIIAKIQLNA